MKFRPNEICSLMLVIQAYCLKSHNEHTDYDKMTAKKPKFVKVDVNLLNDLKNNVSGIVVINNLDDVVAVASLVREVERTLVKVNALNKVTRTEFFIGKDKFGGLYYKVDSFVFKW